MSARLSRLNRGQLSRQPAIRAAGETISREKRLSPVFVSPREAAKEFQAVILHLSVGELAFNTNKETAKCWKAGRAFPSGCNLIALMAEFPHIRQWVNEQIDGNGTHPSDPRLFDIAMRALQQHKEGNGK